MCKKILEWGWCYKNSEHANGPFSFKEAAIANARNEFEFELKKRRCINLCRSYLVCFPRRDNTKSFGCGHYFRTNGRDC